MATTVASTQAMRQGTVGKRTSRGKQGHHDQIWGVLSLACLAGCLGVGSWGARSRPSSCQSWTGSLLLWGYEACMRLLNPGQDPGAPPSFGKLLLDNWFFLAACVAGCLVPGILLLRLAAGCSVGLARWSAALLGLDSLLWLAVCTNAELEINASTDYEWVLPVARIALMLPAGLLLVLLWLGWGHITLTEQLLGQAATALSANSVLIGIFLAASLAGLAASGPLLTLMRWQEAPWNSVQEEQCPSGLQLPATWDDRAAVGISALVVWWGAKLFAQLLTFVVSGVLSMEWQGFSGGSGGSGAAGHGASQGTSPTLQASWQHVKTCVACAVGPSFGSLALSSLPLASPAIFLWQALSRCQEEVALHGWLMGALVHVPARCLRALAVDWTGAATVLMARSGESYARSTATAVQLLSWSRVIALGCAVAVSAGIVFAAATVLGLKYLFIVDSAYLAFIVGSGRFQRMSWQDTLVEGFLLLGSNDATALLLVLLCSLLLQAVRTVAVLWFVIQDKAGSAGARGQVKSR